MSAVDHLVGQRDELADLVDQLGGSELADAPSLRLLTAALTERLRKLEEKLDESRRCELRVELEGGTAGIDAQVTAALVGAIAAAVASEVRRVLPDLGPRAADEAGRLSLTGVELAEDGGHLVLASPPRPAEQLLVDPDSGRPALFAALDAVCDALGDAAHDTTATIADVLAEEPVLLRLSVTTPEGERTVTLSRADLQRARAR